MWIALYPSNATIQVTTTRIMHPAHGGRGPMEASIWTDGRMFTAFQPQHEMTLKSANILPITLPVKYLDNICCLSPNLAPKVAKKPTAMDPMMDQNTITKTHVRKSSL